MFELKKIPVDVLWSDLPYSDDTKYFVFNKRTFNNQDLEKLKHAIDNSGRKLVVITDPHIKRTGGYFVWENGMAQEMKVIDNTTHSIFVKQRNMQVFQGHCWPGASSWVDYLNEGAQKFWSSLYAYD